MDELTYTIEIDEAALNDLGKLGQNVVAKLFEKIESLAQNPRPSGTKKLKGYTELYRVRWTDYRIVYSINDNKLTVLVVAAGKRDSIYNLLKRRLG